MSQYANIMIKRLSLESFCNYVSSDIVSLFFSRDDLYITENCRIDCGDGHFEEVTQYRYITTVKKAKERLDAQGFSIAQLEKQLNEKKLYAIEYTPFLRHLGIDYDDCENQARELSNTKVSIEEWKNAVHKIITYELENGNITPIRSGCTISLKTECDKIIYYSLKEYALERRRYYGLITEHINIAYIYRLILDSCNDNDELTLDFTDLQYRDKDCIDKALAATGDVEKVIVLVEGTSDKDVLEFALKQLYPHLYDLFYFMDFDDGNGSKAKRDGGTSYLAKNMKTFYFSRLKAKFIAIFDNDAEGYQAKCGLESDVEKWPDNFRILQYPDDILFHDYPTLVPNGKMEKDNIAKKACSIELYLPDKLIQDSGEYLPIEWEARKKIKKPDKTEEVLYQGVISQKDDIKEKFHTLRKAIENGKKSFVAEEWGRMKQLLDTIVFAFTND